MVPNDNRDSLFRSFKELRGAEDRTTDTIGWLNTIASTPIARQRIEWLVDEFAMSDLNNQLGTCQLDHGECAQICGACGAPLPEGHPVYWYHRSFGVSVCNRLCAEGWEQQCADMRRDEAADLFGRP